MAGFALVRFAGAYLSTVKFPGPVPIVGSAAILVTAAIVASLMPAARASRVDVIKALRSE
jgi:ABC-type antimicrobial peptide transport system permease subunit